MVNAFLHLNEVPAFDQLKPENLADALRQKMDEARTVLAKIKKDDACSWEKTIEPLDKATSEVGRIWGVASHLHSVTDTPQWREAYNALIAEVTAFSTEISQDIALYHKFVKIRQSEQWNQLDAPHQRKIENDIRDFVLSGANLPEEEQQQLARLEQQAAEYSTTFAQNLLDATEAFVYDTENIAELSGLPQSAIDMMADAAQEGGVKGWRVHLRAPHYLAVLKYADNRALREKIWRAYAIRASELDDAKRDNSPYIDKILTISQQQAELLGYHNAAQLSLVRKMAKTESEVFDFLKNLAQKAKPFAQKEAQEVRVFAQNFDNNTDLKPWDWTYYGEKLREAKYAFNQEDVRHYFPLSSVLNGLFALIGELYGVQFEAQTRPVWHNDVRYFALKKEGHDIGGVYLDLYARSGKRGGAWMNDYCSRHRDFDGKNLQLPIAYLVCNFAPPSNEEAYLTHDDILTLFHECGHGLHHLLTQMEVSGISGINGVEWDAVELPSQFMENFAWEYDVLAQMSCHKTTRQRLPVDLFNKMHNAKNFQTGLFLVRQLEFALFDFSIYSQSKQPCDWQGVLNQIRQEVSVLPTLPENRFAQSFSHIFAGGYSAGYYSYLWAEVLSADAYAAFEESNNRSECGKKFLTEILAMGGSRDAAESFRAFRGRAPQSDALLRHLGLHQE